MKSLLFGLVVVSLTASASAAVTIGYLPRDEHPPVSGLRVSNNHPFPIRDKIRVRLTPELSGADGNLLAVSHSVTGGTVEAHYLPVQIEAENQDTGALAWIDVQLRPNESRRYTFQSIGGGAGRETLPEIAERFSSGLPREVTFGPGVRTRLFDLSLLELAGGLESFPQEREARIRQGLENVLKAQFEPVEEQHGPVVSKLVFRASAAGENNYEIEAVYHLFTSGISDVEVTLRTTRVSRDRGYLALVKRLPVSGDETAAIRWKGNIRELKSGDSSPARTNRMHSWGRDVNWLATGKGDNKANRAILAEFTTNLTRAQNGRYLPANDYMVNEYVVGTEDQWYMLSEIARQNQMRNYVPHTFVIPQPDEPLRLRFRALPDREQNSDAVDQAFVAFAGYQGRTLEGEDLHVRVGVDEVSFGTSYFPHSTFGENFEYWRSAGLQGDRWWPRFGANWRHFKAEIQRDMRIANAIGLDWIRIHHFDAPDFRKDFLTTEDGAWMLEYLEFMAETARSTGLGLFLDFSLSPSDARLVAERFGDVIGFYEIQNEVLLMGASPDRIDYWRDVRENVRAVQPEAPVFVTGGPQFYSLYDRLAERNLEVDAVGQHAYVDGRQEPAYVRDIALSLGGYATRTGRMPLNSEYNWRMITRETEEAQAHHFFEIYDNLLSQRSIPLLLQFQFVETQSVPPRIRGALRHYEPLRLDRTPKLQASAFHEIIRRYSSPTHRNKVVDVQMPVVSISPDRAATVPVTITNRGPRPLEVRVRPVAVPGISPDGQEETISLRPRQSRTIQRTYRADAGIPPGFYHFFEEIRYDDTIRYGWGYAAYRASPPLDLDMPPLDGIEYVGGLNLLAERNLSSIRHLVFGQEAPALEVNWALYIYNTLRSATGADIQRWADDQITPDSRRRSLLLVGNQESNSLIAELAESLPLDPLSLPAGEGAVMAIDHPQEEGRFILLVTGRDPEGIQRAASDFIYRYWRFAKDAASFRDGMAPPEGSLQAQPAPQAAASPEALVIEGPESARRGEDLRIRLMNTGEPPSPAAGVLLKAEVNGRKLDLGRTDAGGELRTRLDRRGTYRVRPAVEGAKTELVIKVR